MADQKSIEDSRKRIALSYGLPETAKASDVIQHAINESGHTCRLIDLMELAAIFDANVQLYINDNDSLPDEQQRMV
ncbi:hypothetical protein SEA_KABOCHA_126 [Gordonia phage Kabocha]|uniref:Uncharacterized protein n=2 Tax=Chidieberevirus TaxID=3044687 RepID=A0A649VL78_9CAUD|nr:hypothetical protein PQD14_gp125 [Gordonia phage Chidiebere]YP_010675770.1 hypothetical protein PQD15_gp123 [Gordonia phage ChisanaKitsune]AZS07970.1 hypothetical protein PBI_GRAY_121 [Gordonia phage Gray]WAA19912.1 hypothetical protein SEA_KABOCHA_126 [Gordonia phage Kabocha]WAA20100.1 hypothetical protein SEA_HANEM_123 [Gordonia phage Hanem]WNM67144.1 hypothetical protein SEA_SCHOMBER_123 [Gordonia Phage Schomber]QGJ93011.1 hypothetical protein PBI_CHIDIEBERE_125 [Gordonia phage Chidiebe